MLLFHTSKSLCDCIFFYLSLTRYVHSIECYFSSLVTRNASRVT